MRGLAQQLIARQAAMTVVEPFGQRIGNAGPGPDQRGLFDPEFGGIGGLEADAANVARQPVGILGNQRDRLGAIGLEDPHRP
jgi:hypothetical protein